MLLIRRRYELNTVFRFESNATVLVYTIDYIIQYTLYGSRYQEDEWRRVTWNA